MKASNFIPAFIRKYRGKRAARLLAALSTAVFGGSTLLADDAQTSASTNRLDVMEMNLEELMKMQVTSVSRKSERLSNAAAAIHVITQEDIRRSGATSIPEALRLSPGLEVARQDAHTWAISSRGFNDEFANQLLVLIDGRSVYTPLFAGVYWDVQDLMLEDIERIEVIRGPGATLWGANAVNGVINITTKTARDTQGLLVTVGAGNEERGFGGIRYGGKIGENSYFRVYSKYFNRDDSALADGSDANDSWNMHRGGFRYDWIPTEENLFTLQGDIYTGRLDQTVTVPTLTPPYVSRISEEVHTSGGNLLGRWTHQFSAESELALKVYYDRTERDRIVFSEQRNSGDLDLQHRFRLGSRNDIVWGLGYNITSDSLSNSETVMFNPVERTSSLYSAFIQDEITLIENRLRLTLGSKFEHNDYTGWEIQPSGRLSLNITERQTAWAAVSRAISTPSRAEDDIRINRQVVAPPPPAPVLLSLFGSRDMEAKELIAFELGYRIQPHDRITFDLATFYNIYDQQRSLEAQPISLAELPSHIVLPYTIDNKLDGETYGFELASTWQPTDWWRLRAHYTFWRIALHKDPLSTDPLLEQAEGDSPRHQVGVRSLMDLPHNLEFDTGVRYVDTLSQRRRFVDTMSLSIPSYVVADARIGWRPNYNWEISLVGQNLFEARHQEFAPSYIQTQETQVEASVYAKVTFRF